MLEAHYERERAASEREDELFVQRARLAHNRALEAIESLAAPTAGAQRALAAMRIQQQSWATEPGQEEKEHEEEERRAYERVLEVVEAQRVMDEHLDEIKNKMREAKERRDAAAAQAKTVVSQKDEDMSDIDSDEEAAFEDFSNDWRARG